MHTIVVMTEWDPMAEMVCDCGAWKDRAATDIEIMAKAINHLREHSDGEGVIELTRKFVFVGMSDILVVDR